MAASVQLAVAESAALPAIWRWDDHANGPANAQSGAAAFGGPNSSKVKYSVEYFFTRSGAIAAICLPAAERLTGRAFNVCNSVPIVGHAAFDRAPVYWRTVSIERGLARYAFFV